ncbi:MAG: hypothetical protein K1X66_06540 [Verrucomicrobiae bacterium]|nr:hypothetical protein [Verrucomicrobiae bacterium]
MIKSTPNKKAFREYEKQPKKKKNQMRLQQEAEHTLGPKRLTIEKKVKKV